MDIIDHIVGMLDPPARTYELCDTLEHENADKEQGQAHGQKPEPGSIAQGSNALCNAIEEFRRNRQP